MIDCTPWAMVDAASSNPTDIPYYFMHEATAGATAVYSIADQVSSTHKKLMFLMYDVGPGVLLSAMNKCTQFAMTFKCTDDTIYCPTR